MNSFEKSPAIGSVKEMEPAVVEIPEASPELQATYEAFDPNQKYYVFCGDDRPLTAENSQALEQNGVASPDNAVRTFGGAFGTARALAVTLLAQQNGIAASTLSSFRGNFVGWANSSASRLAERTNLVPGMHSADGNEGNAVHFDENSEKGLGCAYAANAETVGEINTNPDIVAFAEHVIQKLGSSPRNLDSIEEANYKVKELFSVDGQKSFNLSREDVSRIEIPTAIVKGSHAPVDDTVIVINLQHDMVSNPRKAVELGKPAYDVDAVIECAAALKAYPELDLDPRIMLESKILDICATAEALAASEGKHAWDFTYKKLGNFEDAVSTLEEVKREA